MRRIFWLALVFAAAAARPGFGWPVSFPPGTTLYDPEKAYNGYTLFTPYNDEQYLINMSGKVVHKWKLPYRVLSGRLQPNGNLLVIANNPQVEEGRPGISPFTMGGVAGVLLEVTWEGTEIFRHQDPNMHHDAVKLANGNYLYLAWERIPPDLQAKVRGGVKHSEFRNLLRSRRVMPLAEFENLPRVMFNDVLIEVDPQHKVVWDWHANEHLDPDIDIIGPIYPREEWCHANTLNVLANENLLITSRALDAMMVIDKQTGDVVFRWGNFTRLVDKNTGETELVQPSFPAPPGPPRTLSGPHGAEEVPPGLPGAGHFTCYDNNWCSPVPLRSSRGIEVDPQTGAVVWQSQRYENGMASPIARKHFSEILGSAQRLPNGNMLLCEGINGRLFQVDKDLEDVWEYINPFTKDTLFHGAVIKAYCYPPDYCPQFKDLPPAKGPKVILAVNDGQPDSSSPLVEPSAKSIWADAGLAALAAVAIAAALVLGRKWGRREAIAAGPKPASSPTNPRRR